MLSFILIMTGVVLICGALAAYWRARDPLHPAVILMPPFLYFYCVWPLLLDKEGGLFNFLPEDSYVYAAWVFIASIAALYVGLISGSASSAINHRGAVNSFLLGVRRSPMMQRRLYMLAVITGGISVLAYASAFDFSLDQLIRGYSRAKGGGGALSGYVGEAMILSLPAVVILALAVRARGRLLFSDIVIALILLSPQLLQGTLGGRRGPLFMSLTVLLFSWFVARGRPPAMPAILAGVSIIGLLIILVSANRQDVYIGSGQSFDMGAGFDRALGGEIVPGNEYLSAATFVESYTTTENYYWGYRYFVTFFVRPIPRQIWPTKYQDMNAHWLDQLGDDNYSSDVYSAVGYVPPRGSSIGSIADGYMEFSWGVIAMFFVLGRAYAAVWNRHKLRGGYWTVLLFLMLALSVYLPTQSFSAWMVRAMYAGIGSLVIWRLFFGRTDFSAARSHDAPASSSALR